MYEEINLQPDYINKLNRNSHFKTVVERVATQITSKNRVILTGCGTSFYVCMAGEAIGHQISDGDWNIRAVPSFELLHHWDIRKTDIVIGVSHSGKTHLTLKTLAMAKEKGALTVGICGFNESPLNEHVDFLLDTGYPFEKSFAHTISYTLSVTTLLHVFQNINLNNYELDDTWVDSLPGLLSAALDLDEQVLYWANKLSGVKNCIVTGSGCTIPLAMEAALKVAETNHIFSMGLDMEQLLHGYMVMCDQESFVMMIDPPTNSSQRTKETLSAIDAVGSQSLVLTSNPHLYGNPNVLTTPLCSTFLKPIVQAIPVQLFAYYSAVERTLNPDLIRRDQNPYQKARQLYV